GADAQEFTATEFFGVQVVGAPCFSCSKEHGSNLLLAGPGGGTRCAGWRGGWQRWATIHSCIRTNCREPGKSSRPNLAGPCERHLSWYTFAFVRLRLQKADHCPFPRRYKARP